MTQASAAIDNSPPEADSNTRFDFEHAVFKMPGARFLPVGIKRVPTFRIDMGDLDGLVEIAALKKTFGIADDSHDGKLIETAVAGLRYVPDIKSGDAIPSELLTGKASWAVSPRHKKIAEQRLQVQLLSWVSGKEVLLTDPGEIAMFLEQIENREKLRTAFRDAAKALGHPPENPEPVVRQLELLARELCYIEALRDRFALVPKLRAKLTELGKSYGNDRNGKMELNRILGLLQTGIAQYSGIFTQADAQTGEIIAALKSIDRQVQYIRKIRDDLHFLITLWDPHITDLEGWQSRRTPETDKRLSVLYRFLATHFTAGRSILKRKDDHPRDTARSDSAADQKKSPPKDRAAAPAKNSAQERNTTCP